MIPEISHLLTILAAGLFLFSFLVILSTSALSSTDSIIRLSLNCFNAATIFLISAFILYVYLAVMDDFSVKYIAMHSNSDLPIFYKISSIWSSHEGSMFLWILFLSIWLWLFVNRLDTQSNLFRYVIFFSAMVLLFFLLFLLVTSSPFERILPLAPINGGDINPVLQDPALVIHPPMLYLGYVGFAVPFVYICAYLADGEFRQGWETIIQKWSLYAWAFLTLGIGLGSWWAYYELGWGGYWFWDPVENVALMPWLAATAFTHSIHASTKSGVLKSWTLFLGLSVFILSLFGAFIVRSGIIDSVHSFANDPQRGLTLLLITGVIALISFGLFSFRSTKIVNSRLVVSGSKESFLSLNNILMITSIFSVFLGVIYPLITQYFYSTKVSIGPPYYNTIFAPLIFIAACFIALSVESKWQRKWKLTETLSKLSIPILISCFLTFIVQSLHQYSVSLIQMIGLFSGIFIISIYAFKLLMNSVNREFINWSSAVSHLGFGLLLFSIAGNSIFSYEKNLKLNLNEEYISEELEISFDDLSLQDESNHQRIIAQINMKIHDKVISFSPEKRKYFTRGQVTSETDIEATFLRDIYINIGEQLDDGSWTFRVQFNYLIKWIWFSVLLMILGILVRSRATV